jgi:hypothetical protein
MVLWALKYHVLFLVVGVTLVTLAVRGDANGWD